MPVYDHPNDRFALESSVSAPDGWKVLTNTGVTLPTYLIMVAAAPYDIHTHPDDERFSVWVPPGSDLTAVAGVLDELPEMNAWFEEMTGVPYPWGSYRQVFVQRFMYGGMENTSATVQNLSLLQPSAVDENAGGWTREVVAHELAHQWYGDLLTCRDWRELWLNEGFAEFMAGRWMARTEGPAREAQVVGDWLRWAHGSGPLAGRFFHPDGTAEHGSVYSKGAMVLHMLEDLLGEERFWTAIRQYTIKHQHQSVITADLQRELEDVSGHNLDWFFQQWVEMGADPELSVSHSYAEGALTISVRQSGASTYTLPLTVEVGMADGDVLSHRAWMTDDSLKITIPAEEPPRYVAFNPRAGVLAEVDQSQSTDSWIAQLRSPSPYARLFAIENLSETSTSEPLAAILADPSRARLERQAAAEALGEQQAEAPLVLALDDPSPGVRAAAAEALQNGNGSDATSALARAVRGDPDPYVRAEALSALARRDPADALALARRLTKPRDRTEHSLASNAVAIIAAEGRAQDLRLLLDPQPGRLWGYYIRSASQLVNNLDDGSAKERARTRAARTIEAHLSEGDHRVRYNAASALGNLGDPDSIPHLQALRRAETVTYIASTARDSIKQIRSGTPPEQTADNDLDARLKDLEERLEEAEQALDILRERH
jgi:aminopeptidase N